MITKIISGGQTGADQAALDAAIKLGVPHGGWIPKGRLTEDGTLPDKYQLIEMPTKDYPARTEKNILESDGTLILSHSKLTGGSKLTEKLCKQLKKPCLHIDHTDKVFSEIVSNIHSWALGNSIETLNVAGPRASKDPLIYEHTFYIVEAVLLLSMVKADIGSKLSDFTQEELLTHIMVPKSIDEAVDQMLMDFDADQRDSLRRVEEDQLPLLHMNLGMYIRNHFQLWYEKSELMEDCRRETGDPDLHPDSASELIVRRLWEFLRQERH